MRLTTTGKAGKLKVAIEPAALPGLSFDDPNSDMIVAKKVAPRVTIDLNSGVGQ